MGGCATAEYKANPQGRPTQPNNQANYQGGNQRANDGGQGIRGGPR